MTATEAIESPAGNNNVTDENSTLSNVTMRRLMATASSAALSATSAISSSTLTHSAAVLAGQHWPEFHNGVAAGLMISPHTSVRMSNPSICNQMHRNWDSFECIFLMPLFLLSAILRRFL